MLLYFCGVFVSLVTTVWSNYTFTDEMASQCKEHVCNHGYHYDSWYKADPVSRGINSSSEGHITFNMHIAIKGSSDGHILLSSQLEPGASDPVYEIVIGGGSNTFSQLRRNMKSSPKTTRNTPNILSTTEYRAFYVRITDDGTVEFGKEGEDPLLSYFDTDPVPVRFFSFTSWSDAFVTFLYDCPVNNGDGSKSKTSNSTTIERKLSPREQLKRQLLGGVSARMAPRPVMDITVDAFIKSLRFHTLESKLEMDVTFAMSWTDESMAWNPGQAKGTSSLRFRLGELWTPTFSVMNSADIGLVQQRNTDFVVMYNNGEAIVHFESKVITWCFDSEKYSKWPRDEHTCLVYMKPWNVHEDYSITNSALIGANTLVHKYAYTEEAMESEWITTKKNYIINRVVWNALLRLSGNDTNQGDKFVIAVTLQRRATAYNIALYTPMLVLMTFLLISFGSESLSAFRVWFYSGCLTLVSMGLCFINYVMPCHTVPSILLLYVAMLVGSLLALLVNAALLTARVRRAASNRWLRSLLMMKWIRAAFGLEPLKKCHVYDTINESFASEEDMQGEVSRSVLDEMKPEVAEATDLQELATVIDKLLFTIYSVTFAAMLAFHF